MDPAAAQRWRRPRLPAVAACALVVVALHAPRVAGLDNGLGLTPPRGWSSWNTFHRNISATLFTSTAHVLHDKLATYGYEYVNIDGGWWAGSDTGTIGRNASGFVQVNKDKFPDGLKPVVAAIHKLGLKYGHYTDSGTAACNGDKPMSEGYEQQDVAFAADLPADYLKLDACHRQESAETVVRRWQRLLNATGRPIYFANCHNGCETGEWDPWCATYSNMWRSSQDIKSTWASMLHNLDALKGRGKFGGPGAWNDPDILEVDVGEFADDGSTMALNMNRAHFSMWCITSSPLLAGNDLRNMNSRVLGVLTNQAALDVNSAYVDNAGDLVKVVVPAPKHLPSEGAEVWAKPLPGSTAAVALFNRFDTDTHTVNVTLAEVPGLPAGVTSCSALHVWDGHSTVVGPVVSAGVAPRSVEFVVLSKCH